MCKSKTNPENKAFFIKDNFVHPVEESCEWIVDLFLRINCPQSVHIQFTLGCG